MLRRTFFAWFRHDRAFACLQAKLMNMASSAHSQQQSHDDLQEELSRLRSSASAWNAGTGEAAQLLALKDEARIQHPVWQQRSCVARQHACERVLPAFKQRLDAACDLKTRNKSLLCRLHVQQSTYRSS